MINFEIETIMREIIQDISKPIVLKVEQLLKDFYDIKLDVKEQSRKINMLFNSSDSIQCECKLLSEQITKLQLDSQENQEKLTIHENHFNSEIAQMKYDIGVEKLEQETQKKEMSVLGEVVQSLTERVEIYNNHASQKLYQVEFQVNSLDTSNLKEMKELLQQIKQNAEITQDLNTQTSNLTSKVQIFGQEIATLQSSKTWMQDLIVELRQKCQFYTTINYVEDKLNEFFQNNISFEQVQKAKDFPQELNQIDQEEIKSIIERSISLFEFKLETKLEGIEQHLQLNQQKITDEMLSNYNNTQSHLLELQQQFNELQQFRLIECQGQEREKMQAKHKAQIIDEVLENLKNQINKIYTKITTINTNITGLDLRMAETSQKVFSMEEKQNTIEESQGAQGRIQYFPHKILPIKSDSIEEPVLRKNLDCEQRKSIDQSIQVHIEQPKQFEFQTNPFRDYDNQLSDELLNQQNDMKERIQNQIIKLKSDLFNGQQYQTSQINQLFKINSTKDLEIQNLQKQTRQYQHYFHVLFSIILHNELINTDNQVKLIGNGLKFDFLPYQQDERTHLTFQNVKTPKIDLIIKTIECNHSSIKRQRQNTFEYQQEKKRYDSETSRKEHTIPSDTQRKPEMSTIYTQKRQSKFLDDKLRTQTDHLNISLDSHQYCLLPKQKIKKVLVKYRKQME